MCTHLVAWLLHWAAQQRVWMYVCVLLCMQARFAGYLCTDEQTTGGTLQPNAQIY
jgi:hypothetical protein